MWTLNTSTCTIEFVIYSILFGTCSLCNIVLPTCTCKSRFTCIVTLQAFVKNQMQWSITLSCVFKAEDYLYMFSAPIKDRAQCYALSHSDFHEHLWSLMQVKRAIDGRLHYTNHQYITNKCACVALFCMICCLFSNRSKSSSTRLRSLYNVFLRCECSTFSCARFLAMQ